MIWEVFEGMIVSQMVCFHDLGSIFVFVSQNDDFRVL